MSLLSEPEEEVAVNLGGSFIVHCNNCGKDYYTQLPYGSTEEQVLNDMHCTCDNSQLVSKAAVDGITEVEQ